MSIGERLRAERERLGLSQPKFAEVAGTTKQTLFSWESGKTAPDAIQLSALVAIGVDALYVLVGQYASADATLPPDERVLLGNYRSCGDQAKQNLIQTSALLSAGLVSPTAGTPAKRPAPKVGVTQTVTGRVGGNVVAGDYNGKK